MRFGLASNFEDEYQNVEGLWKIFGPVVDSWLVVDSGSHDNTPDKLREIVGDKLNLVESSMLKEYGFAHSRTQLVELSKGMDWVFIIDGDERMCPDDAKKMRHMIEQDPPYDIIWLPRFVSHDREQRFIEFGGPEGTIGNSKFVAVRHFPDWQPRLIRRTMIGGQSKVRFKRAVHEVPVYEDVEIREHRDFDNPLIESYGRLKTLERRQKIGRLCRDLQKRFPEGLEEFGDQIYND